jgi:hypothetical protein
MELPCDSWSVLNMVNIFKGAVVLVWQWTSRISWGMFSFHSVGRECHGNRDLETSKRWFECGWWWGIGLVIRDLMQRYASGGDCAGGVHCPTLQDKNPRSGLNCAWQWPCWRHCFVSKDFLHGENLRSMIGRRRCLWLFPYWRSWTSGVVLVVVVLLLQEIDHCSGTFLFCNSSSVFLLCASVMPLGRYVVADWM